MIAAEVIEQLESDAQMKRDHLALYLCCRESLRLHQARAARNQRVGQFISRLFHGLVVGLPAALRRTADRGGALAAEMLPETVEAPAGANVRQLIVDPKIRSARATVGASASKRAKAARAGI